MMEGKIKAGGLKMNTNIIKLAGQRADRKRIRSAKWGYSTRPIPKDFEDLHIRTHITPKAGDLVLAEVTRLGQHQRIELPNGRRARMFPGDELVVVFGNRYAPDQFEALVPARLEPCHLVAAGGIAGQMVFKHASVKPPTAVNPVGILAYSNGKAVNLSHFGVKAGGLNRPMPPVIAVVGSSMNAGKTTAAAHLVRGLTLSGLKVNAAKVTGTGSGCDIWHLKDAGAKLAMDFLDVGHPSTYLLPPHEVQHVFETLLFHLNTEDADFIVLEIADGLYQAETAALVASERFKKMVNGVLYASADALAAVYGANLLQQWGLRVFAVTGAVTQSPLAMREVQDAIDLPVLGCDVLGNPVVAEHTAAWLNGAASARVLKGGF